MWALPGHCMLRAGTCLFLGHCRSGQLTRLFPSCVALEREPRPSRDRALGLGELAGAPVGEKAEVQDGVRLWCEDTALCVCAYACR